MMGNVKIIVALFFVAVLVVPVAASASSESSGGAFEFTSYYDQLDANGKAIFDAVESADPDIRTMVVNLPIAVTAKAETYEDSKAHVEKQIKATVDSAYNALRMSSPMAYWGWLSNSATHSSNLTINGSAVTVAAVTLYLRVALDPNADEPRSVQKMLDDLRAVVDGFSTESESVRDKIMDINNYITNLATYDPYASDINKISPFAHDAYGALVAKDHLAVCDGYSKAFLLLCEKEEIESIVVTGTAIHNMENHAWNYVKLEGKWYAIDVTWNDNGSGDNPYFLKGGDTFFFTHHQGTFLGVGFMPHPLNYPILSETGYDVIKNSFDLFGLELTFETLTWLMVALIFAILCIVLYRHSKNK